MEGEPKDLVYIGLQSHSGGSRRRGITGGEGTGRVRFSCTGTAYADLRVELDPERVLENQNAFLRKAIRRKDLEQKLKQK